jgi:magnesium transporter
MSAKRISYLRKFGKPPGSVDYTGVHRQEPVRIDLIRYNSDGVEIIPLKSIEEFNTHYRAGDRHWLRIFGLHNADVLRAVGTRFDISDLVLEDVANARGEMDSAAYYWQKASAEMSRQPDL